MLTKNAQYWRLGKVSSMELSTTNDSWLHCIYSYVKHLTAGLFATANDEHTGKKYDNSGWEICKYILKSEVAMFETQHNLHFTSVTVSHLHYKHSAEDDRHLQLVSM